jgi:hypothetical protein
MLGLLQGKTDAHCESDDDLKEDHADQTGRGQHPKPKSKRRNGAEAKNEEVEKNDPNTDEPLPPLKRKKTDIHTGPATEARLHNQAPGYDIPSQSTASELSFLSSPCAPPSNQLQQLASQKKRCVASESNYQFY